MAAVTAAAAIGITDRAELMQGAVSARHRPVLFAGGANIPARAWLVTLAKR